MIVLFDGECAMCNRAVRFLSARDKKRQFEFRPGAPDETLVLIDDRGRHLRYGKGALRIAWYLGGWWRLVGLLSFLPKFLIDPIYRFIARRRHLFV